MLVKIIYNDRDYIANVKLHKDATIRFEITIRYEILTIRFEIINTICNY